MHAHSPGSIHPRTLAIAFAAAAALSPSALASGKGNPCRGATMEASLASAKEPGPPLIVEGVLYAADGETPVAGAIVYAYQTDATGRYARFPSRVPKLRGWMRTDAQGRFRMRTIRPAAYPNDRIPAHIHFHLWEGGLPTQYTQDLQFEDDPLISAEEKRRSAAAGRFAWVRAAEKGVTGPARVSFAIRAKSSQDRFEENIRHGLDACAP